jgi:hypothetical protein
MRLDKEALKIALRVTGLIGGPILLITWLQFPGRPVAWVGLACAIVMVSLLYYFNLSRAERDLANVDSWYRTRRGILVLRIIYFIAGIACAFYALEYESWLVGLMAVAAFANLWKPAA